MSDFLWGTVTALSPLRVRLDGDTSALPFTPDSLIDPLSLVVADRVRCELSGRRLVIVGRSGGTPRTWVSFVPTITGLTLGNGTLNCAYIALGELIVAKYYILFGSTTAITGSVTLTLPNGDSQGASATTATFGNGIALDVSALERAELMPIRSGNSTVGLGYKSTAATPTRVVYTALAAAAPIPFTASDTIQFTINYRKA